MKSLFGIMATLCMIGFLYFNPQIITSIKDNAAAPIHRWAQGKHDNISSLLLPAPPSQLDKHKNQKAAAKSIGSDPGNQQKPPTTNTSINQAPGNPRSLGDPGRAETSADSGANARILDLSGAQISHDLGDRAKLESIGISYEGLHSQSQKGKPPVNDNYGAYAVGVQKARGL